MNGKGSFNRSGVKGQGADGEAGLAFRTQPWRDGGKELPGNRHGFIKCLWPEVYL